jgi:hypothetical protein
MDPSLKTQIISIIDDVDDMTIATAREDGYPRLSANRTQRDVAITLKDGGQ